MKKKLNIILMGTPEFAVPTLNKIHQEFGVACVVTVPDKPAGRGRKIQESSIKAQAKILGIPVLQPDKLKDEDFIKNLKNYEPDILVVLAYRILPKEVYSIAKLACFNVHGSLLPKFRGAAPIQWAIISGEKETGLTSFLIEDKVDTGNILLKSKIKILDNMTAGELHDSMMQPAADLAVETIKLIISGNFTALKQEENLATPAPKLYGDNCNIDWSKDSNVIVNFINGTSPIPGSWTYWNKERVKFLKASVVNNISIELEEKEYLIYKDRLFIGTGNGILEILELQFPSKKPNSIKEFTLGYRGEKRGKFD